MCPSGTTRRGFLAACATATVPTAGCSDRLGGALASPLEVSTDWPRVQYDARATGRTVDVTGPTTEPSVRWSTDVEAVEGGTPAVVVADGTVFVASGSVVAALDAADGTERWTTRVSPSRSPGGGIGYLCSAAVGEEHVFVGNYDGLFALDRDGTVQWSHEVPDPTPGSSGVFRSPAVVDGAVFFTTVDEGAVYAYTTDGDQRWRRELDAGGVTAGPAVAAGTVFVGSETGLHAVSTGGDGRWTAPVGNVTTTPTVGIETVYVTGYTEDTGTFVAAVDADSGEVDWHNAHQNTIMGSPAYRQGGSREELGAATWLGTFFTYDAGTGQTEWGTHVGETKPAIPATDPDRFYVPADDAVVAVDPWDGVEWTAPLSGAAGGVAITDAALFVASSHGRCYALG